MQGDAFTSDTHGVLLEHGVRADRISLLAWKVAGFLRGERRPIPTVGQVRSQAARLLELADKLLTELETFDAHPPTGDIRRQETMVWPSLEPIVLRDQLERLRQQAQAAIADADKARASGERRARGPAPDARLANIASAVLWTMHDCGVAVTTGETGAAVECLAAVLADAGLDADARHLVREWLKHPFVVKLHGRLDVALGGGAVSG